MDIEQYATDVNALALLLNLEIREACEIYKSYELKRIADALGKN